jgi:hypothetical protein
VIRVAELKTWVIRVAELKKWVIRVAELKTWVIRVAELKTWVISVAELKTRHHGYPRIYISANSGARIGLAEEVKHLFRVAWEDGADPDKVRLK